MSDDALLDPIRAHVEELGFELADFRRGGTAARPLLQVRIDRPGSGPGQGVTAEDCTLVSRSLERFLESRAMVGARYVLEVSSPGLERPLRWPEHWRRFIGRRVRVQAEALPGRSVVAIVAVPDDAHVTVRTADGAEVTLPLASVRAATLVVEWPAPGAGPPKRGTRRRRRR